MVPWQKKQVLEASLHCTQWTLFHRALMMKARKYALYKVKILKGDRLTQRFLREAKKELAVSKLQSR